jgi:hypothetical protein
MSVQGIGVVYVNVPCFNVHAVHSGVQLVLIPSTSILVFYLNKLCTHDNRLQHQRPTKETRYSNFGDALDTLYHSLPMSPQ